MRLIFIIMAVAVAGGFLATLTGGLLHVRGTTLVDKYSSFKSLLGGYSKDQINAAMRRHGQ